MKFSPSVLQRLSPRQSRKLPTSTTPKSLWEFFNSSFGLFLMSSVLIGFLSFSYGQWRDYKNRQQKIEQLDFEIALRLRAMDRMCSGTDNTRYSNLVNVTA